MKTKNFQEILLKAKAELWRGPFDQINEVDEEMIRSSCYASSRAPEEHKFIPTSPTPLNYDVMIPEVENPRESRELHMLSGGALKNVPLSQSQLIESHELIENDLRHSLAQSIESMQSEKDKSENSGKETNQKENNSHVNLFR